MCPTSGNEGSSRVAEAKEEVRDRPAVGIAEEPGASTEGIEDDEDDIDGVVVEDAAELEITGERGSPPLGFDEPDDDRGAKFSAWIEGSRVEDEDETAPELELPPSAGEVGGCRGAGEDQSLGDGVTVVMLSAFADLALAGA